MELSASTRPDGPASYGAFVEQALLRAVLPSRQQRHQVVDAVGRRTVLAALASLLPLGPATVLAADAGPLEKKQLNVGFLPITCATPILLGKVQGFYEREGLQVTLTKAQGWGGIKDKTISQEFDAAHMLAPLAFSLKLGLGGASANVVCPLLENLNGSSLTLHIKHKDERDPKKWKGFKFAVPHELSVQNLLLHEYLLQAGIDPERDAQIKAMPPPDMMAKLKSGDIDGFFGAEPFGQRAAHDGLGFIHLLSAELWDGHPCCAFTTSEALLKSAPNTFAALFRSIIHATVFTDKAENWPKVTAALAAPEYLNQPVKVIEQVLTGKYDDGLGNTKTNARRVAFEAFPWQSMATWLLQEMKRWGYVKKDLDFKQVAETLFLATDARKHMADAGVRPAKSNTRKHVILGKEYDPDQPNNFFKALPPNSVG